MLPTDFIPFPYSIAARTRHLPMLRHFAMTVNGPVTITAERRF
jgi:hypothetical protein